MEIHKEELSDVSRYLRKQEHMGLEHYRVEFEGMKRNIANYRRLRPGMKVMEIGCGTGWFPIMMQLEGHHCEGIDISWQLQQKADALAREHGLASSGIRLGNIETEDIGDNEYDAIVCNSVFEHIENWRIALGRVYRALKPGGVFFFSSTNKFSLTSTEFQFPLYGWFPDRMRYGLRKLVQGPDIMKLGIDFNQFRYPQLRREFQQLGFTTIHDRVEMKNPATLSGLKRRVVVLSQSNRLIKWFVLTFNPDTVFTCVK